MRNLFFITLILPLLRSTNAFATTPAITPLSFAKHSTSLTVSGVLMPKQTAKTYSFLAKKGQYMQVELFPKAKIAEFATVGEVTTPSGMMQGDKGGVIYQGCLPETGKYRLRVARNLMATHGGKAGYVAKIVILPVNKSEQCRS